MKTICHVFAKTEKKMEKRFSVYFVSRILFYVCKKRLKKQ